MKKITDFSLTTKNPYLPVSQDGDAPPLVQAPRVPSVEADLETDVLVKRDRIAGYQQSHTPAVTIIEALLPPLLRASGNAKGVTLRAQAPVLPPPEDFKERSQRNRKERFGRKTYTPVPPVAPRPSPDHVGPAKGS
jgi:hypothetical protein